MPDGKFVALARRTGAAETHSGFQNKFAFDVPSSARQVECATLFPKTRKSEKKPEESRNRAWVV